MRRRWIGDGGLNGKERDCKNWRLSVNGKKSVYFIHPFFSPEKNGDVKYEGVKWDRKRAEKNHEKWSKIVSPAVRLGTDEHQSSWVLYCQPGRFQLGSFQAYRGFDPIFSVAPGKHQSQYCDWDCLLCWCFFI